MIEWDVWPQRDIPVEGILNNIFQVTNWLEKNKQLFENLPINPPIVRYSQKEQEGVIARLESRSNDVEEEEDNPMNDHEYLMIYAVLLFM